MDNVDAFNGKLQPIPTAEFEVLRAKLNAAKEAERKKAEAAMKAKQEKAKAKAEAAREKAGKSKSDSR